MEDFTVEKCFILLSFLLNFILVIQYYFNMVGGKANILFFHIMLR